MGQELRDFNRRESQILIGKDIKKSIFYYLHAFKGESFHEII